MMNPTEQQMEEITRAEVARKAVQTAVAQLAQSERGRRAAKALHKFLDEGACGLDSYNQRAVKLLLEAFFAGRNGTVLDELEEIR
jgi:hypothetical protein